MTAATALRSSPAPSRRARARTPRPTQMRGSCGWLRRLEPRHDAAARGDEPGAGAAGGSPRPARSGTTRDGEGVREGAVEARRRDRRHRFDRGARGGDVEGEQALAPGSGERPSNLFRDARASAPSTSTCRTANIDVSRARRRRATLRRADANASRSERPEGTSQARSRRPRCVLGRVRGNGTTTLAARGAALSHARSPPGGHADVFAAPRRVVLRSAAVSRLASSIAPSSTTSCSSSTPNCSRARAARLRHQRQAVGARRAAGVLDEVRVHRRHDGAADAVALEPAELEHPPRAELARAGSSTPSRTSASSSAASPSGAPRGR